jgi:hypothetical protein
MENVIFRWKDGKREIGRELQRKTPADYTPVSRPAQFAAYCPRCGFDIRASIALFLIYNPQSKRRDEYIVYPSVVLTETYE